MRAHTDTHTDIFLLFNSLVWGSLRLAPIRSCELEFRVHNHEFFASYCPCLGFRSWFRAQSWFWTRVKLGHLCQRLLSCFVPRLLSQPSYCPSFQFSVSKILSQFCTGPVLGAVFFCAGAGSAPGLWWWNTGSDYAPYFPGHLDEVLPGHLDRGIWMGFCNHGIC